MTGKAGDVVITFLMIGIMLWGIGGISLRVSEALSLVFTFLLSAIDTAVDSRYREIMQKLNAIETKGSRF